MRRIVLGAILGGLAMFVWGALSHMVLPLGEMGMSTLPDEDAVVAAMKGAIQKPGFYFFPGMDMSHKATPAEEAAWNAKYRAGPTGVLIYQPTGDEALAPRKLLFELASNVLAALVAALILARLGGSLLGRAAMVSALGLFAWLSITASYWNWYRYPDGVVCAELIDQVVGWLLAGLVLAAVVKPARA